MIKTKSTRCIITVILQFYILFSNAQVIPEVNLENVLPLSPQMRAFQTYGNIPVSNVTGVPDISIPLYTLVSGNIKIPITLKYHTHNVKPFDCNAGNLALGWIVDIGGVMNRTVKGGRDDGEVEFSNQRTFDISTQADFDFLNDAVINSPICSGFTDVFNYSLPTGESGRFFLKRKNDTGNFLELYDYYLYPNSESKIDMNLAGFADITSITLTDANGFVYSFGDSYKESADGQNITAWMLNRVTDPFSGKRVDYTYTEFINTDENISSFYSTSSSLTNENPQAKSYWGWYDLELLLMNGQCNCTNNSGSNIEYLDNNCYGAIKTQPSFSPNNGYTVQRVNTITNGTETITFYYNNKDKIDRIKITSGGVTIKEITFNTSIINITNGTSVSDFYRQLNSITITGKNGFPAEEYSFEYFGCWENLSSDYWGFYRYDNTNYGITDIYAQKRTIDFNQCLFTCSSITSTTLGNADLKANFGMTRNLIRKITYPTKGYTEFEFEEGRYGTSQYGGGPRIKSITDVSNNGASVKKNYYYENGIINIDPNSSEAIEAYLINYKSIHEISSGYYFTRTRILSNQLHQGFDLKILYPKVEIVHENGSESFKEQFIYNALPENKVDVLDLYDGSVYPHIGTYLFNPASGKLLSRTLFDSSGNIKQKEEYSYSITTRASITDLLIVDQLRYENGRNKTFGDTHLLINNIGYDYLPNPIFAHKFYTINIPNVQLSQKKVKSFFENGTLEYAENYTYMPESDFRIASTTVTQSDKTNVTTNYSYINSTTNSEMYQKNMINSILEINYVKGVSCRRIKNDYNTSGLVIKKSSYQGESTPSYESRIDYTYDAKGNISSATKTGDTPTCYLWGYNYTFPVAKIEGVFYSQLKSILGSSIISSIGTCMDNSGMETYLSTVRQQLSSYLITTYIYDHLLGVLLKTYDPSLKKTEYEYDGFGRLQSIKDHNGKVIEQYDYNYKSTL